MSIVALTWALIGIALMSELALAARGIARLRRNAISRRDQTGGLTGRRQKMGQAPQGDTSVAAVSIAATLGLFGWVLVNAALAFLAGRHVAVGWNTLAPIWLWWIIAVGLAVNVGVVSYTAMDRSHT
ncbi:hypothetical protein [Corynebacterium heidelbergense]|uniref:Uncharacterized protein n=1 Tax=Corynebacterium heidelbergense TaxID=2055947 RepID=A0A364V9Q5_9CORY|nr:hypothetical protein [Corynebacterium heidelbergense]RAV33390.1 hypothetical protein CWC39_08740 [Corynebacterium heidelbergense]WCZ37073.1 hypothetical protein CHEID_07700 [Corynebacterium heidelbergense]